MLFIYQFSSMAFRQYNKCIFLNAKYTTRLWLRTLIIIIFSDLYSLIYLIENL